MGTEEAGDLAPKTLQIKCIMWTSLEAGLASKSRILDTILLTGELFTILTRTTFRQQVFVG